ncbi:acetyl-CoA hydrolase/transferase family protein [Sinanaerobacter chloroacetimidivorans]|uniref:Acetyl-CoA hydrolase/transferase family protein n=1 Tax=Sinanaerobacter chloroacetimidivorans TaxID=2818044 RepID=A0A8J8B1N4_9FIRM|nr:acetyl-CoA hydrolase/transferase C-terminal domain-containing protein [Sinanaerobacter chloroacetimidivorans]MBR0597851.1 acetyl-CoA hydrolase/transferase family protein [Sinanaerobacter chloroacetimidivorans]
MDWKTIYRERLTTAEDAVKVIQSGDAIIPSHAAAEPKHIINALLARKEVLQSVQIWQGLNVGDAPYAQPEYAGHFIDISFFLGKNNRKCIQSGQGEFLPIHFYAQPRAIRESAIKCDVAMISCTPPDENGYVNMGISCDQTRVIVETAKITIAQVNKKMPRVCGDTLIHVSEIDYFVEYDEDLYEIPLIKSDDPIAEKIGYNISTLIQDGDTLQMGQGTIPNAILKFLMDKKDLGIHTEVFSDNLIPLVEAGVVNGAKKSINNRKIISTFIQGTRALYDYVDNNNMICLKPVNYTNDVAVIASNDNMVAINSALEVDMMGQVVADSIGIKTFSGVGGQLDFLRGAEQSKNGRPIIALPATAKNGSISRIVACLKPGTPVTTTRQDVHYVVTEYGIANLFGKPIRERAKLLTQIAAPQFREELEKEFFDYYKKIGE